MLSLILVGYGYDVGRVKSITAPFGYINKGVFSVNGYSYDEPVEINLVGNAYGGDYYELFSNALGNNANFGGDYEEAWNNFNYEEITVPNGITIIADNAFTDGYGNGNSNVKTINLPNGITTIGNNAFNSCSSLETINLPSSLTSIGNDAFYNCSSLETIILPSNLTTIGICAFESTAIQTITIPENVTRIEPGAFSNCSNLQTINFPDTIRYLGESAFENTSCTINFAGTRAQWNAIKLLVTEDNYDDNGNNHPISVENSEYSTIADYEEYYEGKYEESYNLVVHCSDD